MRKGSVMKAIVFMSCADVVDFHFELFSSYREQWCRGVTVSPFLRLFRLSHLSRRFRPFCFLHGSLPQNVRTATLGSFSRSTEACVMICTDVASRGLEENEGTAVSSHTSSTTNTMSVVIRAEGRVVFDNRLPRWRQGTHPH
jgi:superfamily II DNA/RNA helicase